MVRGRFIVFEGLDGSGQTTQAKILARYLRGCGKNVLLTKEPTNGPIGKIIRAALQKRFHAGPLSLQLLFVADRVQHLAHEVEPALKAGNIVICDRYALSTLAYGALNGDLGFLKRINKDFRKPDVTILLDVPAEVAVARIRKGRNGRFELFEKVAKLRRVRRNYLRLKKFWPRIYVIDGNRPIKVVAAEIRNTVERVAL